MSRSRREAQVHLPVPMAELLQQPIASALHHRGAAPASAAMTEERYAHLIKALEATVTQQREQLQSLRHATSHHAPRPSNGAHHDQRAMMRSRESDMSGVVNTADCSSADDDDDDAPRIDGASSSEDNESSPSSSSSSSSILATRAPRTPHRGSGQQPSAQQQQHPTRASQPSQSSRCPHCGHDGAAEPGSPVYKLPHDWRVQVDAYVRERLEAYVEALDEKLARCMAKRLRRVTQENVEESVDRELQRCIQRRFYSAAELHPNERAAAEGPLHAMMRATMRERAAGGSSSNGKERPLQRTSSRRGGSGTESTYSTALMTLTTEDAVSNREPRLFDKLATRRLPAGLAELEEAGIVRPPPPHVTKPTSVQADVIAVAGVLDRAEKELDARQRKLKENKHAGVASTHHSSRGAVTSVGLSRRDPNAAAPRRRDDDADHSHTHRHHHHRGSHGSVTADKEASRGGGGAATTTPATPVSRRIESKMDEAEKRLAALEAAVAAAELVHSANARQLAMPLDRDGATAATDTTA